jgi:hypothetical protein
MNRWPLTSALKLVLCLPLLAMVVPQASALTYTIPAGTGTLTYTETTTVEPCVVRQGDYSSYNLSSYTSFSYKSSAGVVTDLNLGDTAYWGSGQGSCVRIVEPVTAITPGFAIVFTPTSYTGGTAGYYPAGVLYPKYKILSIIYDAPGNKSCNGYTNSTTDGSTTTVGNTFQTGNTTTESESIGFLGVGGTLSMTYGTSTTTGNSSAFTDTIAEAAGVSNCSVANTINHDQDLFIIWLNPSVTLIQTGASSAVYGIGSQTQTTGDPSPGEPEATDAVEITAKTMMANAQGVTTVPVEALVPQIVDGQTLPGLANICAKLISGYPNSCTLANQCGCVPSDFTNVLSQDPLLSYSSTESPLNADTSGAASCTNPASSASCRYVPVMAEKGSTTQITELLAGPECTGCNVPVNTFNQTDSTLATETLSQAYSYSEGFSWEVGWDISGSGLKFQNATTFTWSNTESTGAINGEANSMSVTFSSSTVDCYQEIPIFEDTVYHTFVFQQPAGNSSCPQ